MQGAREKAKVDSKTEKVLEIERSSEYSVSWRGMR